MNTKNEPCSICDDWIEGIICNKDKCPVSIMKKENENLKAEIYNLKEDLKEYKSMPILTKNDCLIATVEKRADGKQYHNSLVTLKINKIRAEAYKEFAERLKEVYTLHEGLHIEIDNLVKELTEESK